LLVVAVLIAFSLSLPVTEGHAMTIGPSKSWNPCISGGGSSSFTFLSNQGPADRTWVIWILIGLNGGDEGQYARFAFHVFDLTDGRVIAFYRDAGFHWIDSSQKTHGATLMFHAGDVITLVGAIYNTDSVSQCFQVSVQTFYM
jgi:hypothetical protein